MALVLAASALAVLLDSTAALVLLVAVGGLALCGLRMAPRAWAWVLLMVALGVWATVFSQGLFHSGTPRTVLVTLFAARRIGPIELPAIELVREGLIHGLVQSSRVVALVMLGLAVALSTSAERMLAALVWYRVPGAVAFLATTALRFIPVLIDQWRTIRLAMRLRGHRFTFAHPLRWTMAELTAFEPLFAASIRRAGNLAASITLRGYDATRERTYSPPLAFSGLEKVALAAVALAVAGVAIVKTLVWLARAELWSLPWSEGVSRFADRWL